MSVESTSLARHKGKYGLDAPWVPVMLGVIGVVVLGIAILNFIAGIIGWALFALITAVYMLFSTATYLHTTTRGKFEVWSELLPQLGLKGSERLLDMGSGRGTVLLMAAQLLPNGRAVGLDLWRGVDQSGNTEAAAHSNAEAEGVADRVELRTGDMTSMPFEDGSFDIVLSSLAIHNIKDKSRRLLAIDEAARVLAPGGQLAIADFRHTRDYAQRFRELGLADVLERRLDWRFWYGGPWTATSLVTAAKPG